MTGPDPAHRPVLLEEVLHALAIRPTGTYLDGTVGGGGHAEAIAERVPTGRVIGLDLDPAALATAGKRLGARSNVHLVRSSYVDLGRVLGELGVERLDGALFDLGLSSLQLADGARGFSFQIDGPLDMRFDPDAPRDARGIVNDASLDQLRRILRDLGEERFADRIARAIVRARRIHPIETTGALATLVAHAIPKPAQRGYFAGRGVHPATRTFQALRIRVNGELDNVPVGLAAAFERLAPGGRLVVISFHSLEDRLVKRFMADRTRGCTCPPNLPVCRCGGVPQARPVANLTPSEAERRENPRARSARLRAIERV